MRVETSNERELSAVLDGLSRRPGEDSRRRRESPMLDMQRRDTSGHAGCGTADDTAARDTRSADAGPSRSRATHTGATSCTRTSGRIANDSRRSARSRLRVANGHESAAFCPARCGAAAAETDRADIMAASRSSVAVRDVSAAPRPVAPQRLDWIQ